MNTQDVPLKRLLEKAEDCGATTLELVKLKAIYASAEIISALVLKIVFIALLVLFVLTINIGIALWIGEWLGKYHYGFFTIGSFYGLLALLFRSFLKQYIKVPVSNFMIIQLLKQ